jgi:hypothetical protein
MSSNSSESATAKLIDTSDAKKSEKCAKEGKKECGKKSSGGSVLDWLSEKTKKSAKKDTDKEKEE